ncbi:cholesterol oxidase-like [Acropora millepora]|uniref:cholesterol oxidase-like n=1 Tax=Acropora millepora TaxID=45264 RepID=UPI001CF4C47F|nr:cholesterol oxidase-like [Acropora millepora]
MWPSTFFKMGSTKKPDWAVYSKLGSPITSIKTKYDVVVIGSGYGGGIAASRCARAGKSVCVLERGKEWLPGDFPETFDLVAQQVQATFGGKPMTYGKPNDLMDFFVTDDLTVLTGSGLGGTSLINANVALDMDPAVLQDSAWPKEIRNDADQMNTVDRGHFFDMIKPETYPTSYPALHKIDRMKESLRKYDIEDLDEKIISKLPLYVTFEDKLTNHVGVPQPKCTACGNCVGGCNVGAKNTLNMNYLPDAKAHGAEIFTETDVATVLKSTTSSDWIINFKRVDSGSTGQEQTVQASYVILGAGAIGSTKILLRSKQNGLAISDRAGLGFSTNGDVLGTSYNADNFANSIGFPTDEMETVENPPGPTITTVADFRKVIEGSFEKHHVIEDFSIPCNAAKVYRTGLAFAAVKIGTKEYPLYEEFEKTMQILRGEADDKSLSFLGMSHDDAKGVISLRNEIFDITWDDLGCQKNFLDVNKEMQSMTGGLEGAFVINPMWHPALGNSVITGHPLGGCSMGESGQTGVVNHAGQVFDGNTDQVMTGLLVVDGAIVPRPVGVNPSLTIAILAERCLRLLAQREGWNIDYDTFIPLSG